MANKLTNEQIEKFRSAGFSEQEIALFNFNPEYAPDDEEFEAIVAIKNVSDALKMIPQDIDAFLDIVDKTYGEAIRSSTSEDEMKSKILEISKKDPKFAHQVVAYFLLDEYASSDDDED